MKKVPINHCRVRRHRAGFGSREEYVAEEKKNGEAEECWQPEKKRSKEMPRHWLDCSGNPQEWWLEKTPAAGGSSDRVPGVQRAWRGRTWWKSSLRQPRLRQHMWHCPPLLVGTSFPFPASGEGVRQPLPKESEDFCSSARCQSKDGDAKKIHPSIAVGNWRAQRCRKRLFCHKHTPGHTPAQVTAGKYPFLLPKNGLWWELEELAVLLQAGDRTRRFETFPSWVKIKVWHVKHRVFLFLNTIPGVGRNASPISKF